MEVAQFYDQRKVGDTGCLGFRRSTDLMALLACMDGLLEREIIRPGETLFLDLGCADGRVNVLFSFLVKVSVGIELDEWTLEEYGPLEKKLETFLKTQGLLLPPNNISLFLGDSMDERVHQTIGNETGTAFEEFDVFYTYLVMHDEFAGLIAKRAKRGAIYLIYGLHKILPRYMGLHLLDHIGPKGGILAIYEKG